VYLALALLLTWPAVLRPASVLIGHPRGDHWPNLWGYGWVRGELLAGRFPLTIEQLGFPEGGTLYYLDMLNALLAIPVEPWLGPVATYNLLVWFNLVLGAVGAFALVRHLTGSRGGAFLAGLVYGFSPYVLGVIASGISECLTVGWLPLFLLAMIRLGETGRWRHGVAAAALAVACLLSSAYHGLTAGVMGGLVVAHGFLLRRPRWPLARLAPLATVLVAAGGLALVQAHFLQRSVDPVTSLDEAAPPMAFLGEDPDWRVRSMVADPVNLVLPGKPPLDSRSPYNVVNHVTYLGWLVLAAAVLGALGRRGSTGGGPPLSTWRERVPWVVAAAVMLVLAMGAHLRLAGAPVLVGGHVLALPGALLEALLPALGAGESKYRLVLGAQLALAVLVGGAWVRLMGDAGPRARGLVMAAVVVALAGETTVLSPARVPIPTADARAPAYYEALAGEASQYGVVDLPFALDAGVYGRYIYLSRVHGKPIPYVFDQVITERMSAHPEVSALVRWSDGLAGAGGPGHGMGQDGGRTLADLGYREIVVHLDIARAVAVDEPTLRAALAELDGRYGAPVRDDGQVRVYDLRTASLH